MDTKRKPFNVKLSDEEKAVLEAHRVRLGLRSHAGVIRRWIALTPATSFTGFAEMKAAPQAFGMPIVAAEAIEPSSVIIKSPDGSQIGHIKNVQFGPTKRGAGDLAKKGKKGKK